MAQSRGIARGFIMLKPTPKKIENQETSVQVIVLSKIDENRCKQTVASLP